MTKTREKSDRCILPGKGGNAPGGKAATASEQVEQVGLFPGDNESLQRADGGADRGAPLPATRAVRKPGAKKGSVLPAMTMEEVASHENLKAAFRHVAANKGASGPDGKSIEEVRARLGEIISVVHKKLLDESYRPGMVRRVSY